MKPPQDCTTMAELRCEIDRIDGALVRLLAERVTYVDRAAVLKARDGLPARIDSRIAEVIANVRDKALAGGLDPQLAETVWRLLIEWSIGREEAALRTISRPLGD
jgi:isochorismate pyruvate lyase